MTTSKELPVLEGAPYYHFTKHSMSIRGSHSIIPAQAIVVGDQRQLLMDKLTVDTTWNLVRRVHEPIKHPANPLIPGGEYTPDGYVTPTNWGTVAYDAELGRFRLWTLLWDTMAKSKQERIAAQVYWESEDGLEWTPPQLGLFELDGLKNNNVIQLSAERNYSTPCVVEVPERLRQHGRFVMLYGANPAEPVPGTGHTMSDRVAWSEDGIRWTDQPQNPVFGGRNDTFGNMVYNPERDVFMQYRRASVNAHECRRFAYTESSDLVSWTQPEVILDADELDAPMLYDFVVNRYHGIYLGFLHPLYSANAGYANGSRLWKDGHIRKHSRTDVELCWSRDGKRWDRHPERPVFIPNGPWAKETMYDWGLIYACQGIVEKDGLLHVYYRGDGMLHQDMPGTLCNFCLATLRIDGFVSLGNMGFSQHPGYMLTRPIECSGGDLGINVRTGPDGFVRVAVRSGSGDQDGTWLEGWNFEDMEAPFSGDSTEATLRWKGKGLDQLQGQAVRLHFWLQDAELYSWRFDGTT